MECLYTNSSNGDAAPVSGRHRSYDDERRHPKTTYHDWAERQSGHAKALPGPILGPALGPWTRT